MTSEFNFGAGPLYNDLGDPYANMAKNDYENVGFLYRKPEPTNSILYSILQSKQKKNTAPSNYYIQNNSKSGFNKEYIFRNSK